MRRHLLSLARCLFGAMVVFGSLNNVPLLSAGELDPAFRKGFEAEIASLRVKYAEFKTGKRSKRDGYVILHRMAINYGFLGQSSSQVAKEVERDRRRLEKELPELRQLSDFRTSEEIEEGERAASEEERLRSRAARWEPRDVRTERMVGAGRFYAGIRQYGIDFYELPAGVVVESDQFGYNVRLFLGSGAGRRQLTVSELIPRSSLRYRHRVEVLPSTSGTTVLLVCTMPLQGFTPTTDEDVAVVRFRTDGRHTFPWVDEKAPIKDFCGIISTKGDVLYQFPVVQRPPDILLRPIGIAGNGRVAIVAEGSEKETIDGGRDVGNYSELLVWRYPNRLERKAPPVIDGRIDFDAVRRDVFRGND